MPLAGSRFTDITGVLFSVFRPFTLCCTARAYRAAASVAAQTTCTTPSDLMTSFLEAVHSNSLRLVQLHLAVPQALQARDLQQALFVATRLGHEAVVRLLLETGLSLVLAVDGRQNTPLYVAVAHRWPRLTELLARAGPPDLVNAWVGARHAAVHLAAQEGLDECLHVLVECGADLRARDSAGCTPLILAVRYKRYGVMKVLLEHSSISLNMADHSGRTALHYAAQSATGVAQLLAAGAEVNVVDGEGLTPLLIAAAEGLSGVVKALAASGRCDVNVALPSSRRTALHILAHKGHSDCIAQLLAAGADVTAADAEGRTAMWFAVSNNRLHVVKELLRASCQANVSCCPAHLALTACPIRLALVPARMHVIKFFILTGYDLPHLRECLALPEAQQLFERADLQHWLQHARDVMSLRCLCRKWIRHHLGRHFYCDLQQLPVPDSIRHYLFYGELDDSED